jgi:glycosyltransferase involved in cell wall biosynthesis
VKLLVISHTWHYINREGQPCGWSPTVIELDELAKEFEVVIHVACLKHGSPTGAERPYAASNIVYVPIPAYGGPGWTGKWSILWSMPVILWTVFKQLRHVDVFQFRAPTSMGVYLIPALTFFSQKPGWFKYAGNWAHPKPALSYRIQKWFLLQQRKRKVTVNGRWPGVPKHVLSFENPCLNQEDLIQGQQALQTKTWEGPYHVCFIGRTERAKGVLEMIEALANPLVAKQIQSFTIIGEGDLLHPLEEAVKKAGIEARVLGFSNRETVFEVLGQAHMLWLPSHGEGFPKVVAEAWSQGCIPITSDVSSLPQYIESGENGFLWALNGPLSFSDVVANAIPTLSDTGASIAKQGLNASKAFLHSRYKERILSELIDA